MCKDCNRKFIKANEEVKFSGEITFEMAVSLGIIKDDSLEFAQKSVEGHSILSPATERLVEENFRSRKNEIRDRNNFVYYRGEILKVI